MDNSYFWTTLFLLLCFRLKAMESTPSLQSVTFSPPKVRPSKLTSTNNTTTNDWFQTMFSVFYPPPPPPPPRCIPSVHPHVCVCVCVRERERERERERAGVQVSTHMWPILTKWVLTRSRLTVLQAKVVSGGLSGCFQIFVKLKSISEYNSISTELWCVCTDMLWKV